MKHLVILLFVLFSSTVFSQHGDKTVGIRIGNTSSGKYFDAQVNSSFGANTVSINAFGEDIVAYEIYNMDEELLAVQEVSATSGANFDSSGLEPGLYYVAVVSETDQVRVDVFYKEEEL